MRNWVAVLVLTGTALVGCGPTHEAAEPEDSRGTESRSAAALCQLQDPQCEDMNGTTCSMMSPTGYCCDLYYGGSRETCTCKKTFGTSGVWACPVS